MVSLPTPVSVAPLRAPARAFAQQAHVNKDHGARSMSMLTSAEPLEKGMRHAFISICDLEIRVQEA